VSDDSKPTKRAHVLPNVVRAAIRAERLRMPRMDEFSIDTDYRHAIRDWLVAQESGQNGAYFVHRWTDRHDQDHIVLFANRRKVADLWSGTYHRGGLPGRWVPYERMCVCDSHQSEREHQAERARNRAAAADYALWSARAEWDLESSGNLSDEWEWEDGQEGGVFVHREGAVVSARGVLRRIPCERRRALGCLYDAHLIDTTTQPEVYHER